MICIWYALTEREKKHDNFQIHVIIFNIKQYILYKIIKFLFISSQ